MNQAMNQANNTNRINTIPEIHPGSVTMPPDWKFRPTDLCNVELFTQIAKGRLLFIPELKKWHYYNGRNWIEDVQKVETEQACVNVVRSLYAMSAAAYSESERKMYSVWAQRSEEESRRASMIKGAERTGELIKPIGEFDRNPWAFPVQNGVINLKTGLLEPHKPEDFTLKISPVTYDQTATCPEWENTLKLFFEDKENLIRYVQKLFGYSMCGIKNERIIAYLYGPGRNGKSTITGIPLYVFGDYGRAADISTFIESRWGRQAGAASEDVARLAGIRYVKTTEIGPRDKLNEKFVKDLSGGDIITARLPYGRSYDFKAELMLWIYGNEKIKVEGQDVGIKDRFTFIPLMFKVPSGKQKKDMAEYIIKHESSGVLNWLIQGCLNWQHEGLKKPAEITEATTEFFAEQDPVNVFITECCKQSDAGVKYKTLYDSFTEYSDVHLSKQRFSKNLKRLGHEIVSIGGNVKYVEGLELNVG